MAIEAGQGGGLQREACLGAGRAQRPSLDVEGLEGVANRCGRRHGVPEETRQGVILTQRGDVLATVSAAGPEGDQTLD